MVTNKIAVGITVLVVLAALLALAVSGSTYDHDQTYNANAVYFVPEDSVVPGCCNETLVQIWTNTSGSIATGTMLFNYDQDCANVTKFVFNSTNWEPGSSNAELTEGQVSIRFITFAPGGRGPGPVHLGDLTIQCCNSAPCMSDLTWNTAQSRLEDDNGAAIGSVNWATGTFSCDVAPLKSENETYFVPDNSVAAGYGNDAKVEIWTNTSGSIASGTVLFNYDPYCANVTKFVFNSTNWEPGSSNAKLTEGQVKILFTTFALGGRGPGPLHLGDLTIQCCNLSPCMTDLTWNIAESRLEGDDGVAIRSVNWVKGTFSCALLEFYGVIMTVEGAKTSAKTTHPGENAYYTLTVKNTGTEMDNYTLTIDNPDGASVVALSNNVTRIDDIRYNTVDMPGGGFVTVLLSVTDETKGTYGVNVMAKSAGEPSRVDAITTTTTIVSASLKTIYVDDDFTDDPANHRWDTIQEGITDANDGDTVLVYNGTYYENVDLNKQLTLIGEEMPTIDAHSSGAAINITADNCTVKGFCCVNAQPSPYAGIHVKSSNSVIEENTCKDNDVGIYLSGTSNEVRNNIADYNDHHGINLLWLSSENIIANNTARNNGNVGIYLTSSDNNRITDNVAANNNNSGIYLSFSKNNKIRNNCANENHNNSIKLAFSDENVVANTTAKNNGDNGIYLAFSDGNRITDNEASSNVNDGMMLLFSDANNIVHNIAKDNGNKGIHLSSSSSNNTIYLNNFVDNLDNAFSFGSSNTTWHSPSTMTYTYSGNTYTNYLGNYWSDYKGSDTDGDGIGDSSYSTGSSYSICGDADFYPLMKPWEKYFALQVNWPPHNPTLIPECKVQITSDPSDTDRPSIVYANGFYYVAYQSLEKNYGICIKKFDYQWNFKKKVEVVSGSAYYDSPSLAFANNKLYVAYISNAEGANKNDYDVIVKEYNPNSFACTSGEKYLTTLQSCQDLPALYYNDGYFYLAYQSWETGNGDIYIKKFDSNWNQLKQVRVTSKSSLQDRPSITYANGYFYVAYYSMETDNRDIFVKRLNSNLNLDVFKKQITLESSRQTYPSIAFVNNQFAIAYASTETGTWGIYMKKYDNNWNFIEKMKVVDDNSAHERRPSIIYAQNDFWIAYVRYLEESDNWYTFVIIPGCE